MNTFLPYPNFKETAKCLDRARLGKQRSECKILINGGWPNHPASKMWRGHEFQLSCYAIEICTEWRGRGYQDTLLDFFLNFKENCIDVGLPTWYNREEIFSSHRANLIRKDPIWYGKFGWSETPIEGYIWPV